MSVQETDIELLRQGDAAAFERIYNETIKGAYYVARKYLGSEAEAEDVLQETYIKVYEKINMYQAGNFQGWVDTIVANRCKDYLKKKNPLLFSDMATDDEDESVINNVVESKMEFQPEAQVDYAETKRLVLEMIDTLPADQRMSVMMFYYENMSVKDIAEACECSENTIKSRLNYGRKAIKTKVEELEKKGTKLYAVPFLPFLVWLFKEDVKAAVVPASLSFSAVAGDAAMAGAKAGLQEGGMNAENGAVNGAMQGNMASGAANTVTDMAGTAATTGAKAGLSLAAKIAIGVASVAAVAGIGVGVHAMVSPSKPATETVVDNGETTAAVNDSAATTAATTVAATVQVAEGKFYKPGKDELTNYAQGGTTIKINSYKDGKLSFTVSVNAMNASKIDEINVTDAPVVDGLAEFTFDPTGFGTYGHGSLKVQDNNTLVLNYTIDGTNQPNAAWRMSGAKDEVYTRDGAESSAGTGSSSTTTAASAKKILKDSELSVTVQGIEIMLSSSKEDVDAIIKANGWKHRDFLLDTSADDYFWDAVTTPDGQFNIAYETNNTTGGYSIHTLEFHHVSYQKDTASIAGISRSADFTTLAQTYSCTDSKTTEGKAAHEYQLSAGVSVKFEERAAGISMIITRQYRLTNG